MILQVGVLKVGGVQGFRVYTWGTLKLPALGRLGFTFGKMNGESQPLTQKQNPITLPETNSSHLKMVVSNRNLLFQRSIFRCELLVLGRVYTA